MRKTITIAMLALSINAFAQIPTNGLIGYYPFTGNANDVSGNDYNGKVYGATLTTDRFGNANCAYSFNGVDNYIDLSSYVSIFNFNQPATLSFWTKTGYDNAETVYSVNDDSIIINTYGTEIFFGQNVTGTITNPIAVATHRYDNSSDYYIAGFSSTNRNVAFDNNWHHFVFVYDNVATKIYLDNKLMSTTCNYGTNNGHYGGAPNVDKAVIGARYSNGLSSFFNGSIDDFRVYNRALDSTGISALYHEPNPKLSGPLFYYPFNGNTNDESGNNNVCTNHGATLTTDRFGNANSAYYFDGQTNFMDINPVSKVDSLQDFTLSVWFAHDGWQYSSPTSSTDPSIIGQQYIISGHSLSPSNYNVSEGIGVALQLQTDSIASILPYYHWDIANPGSNRVVQQIPDSTYNTKWIHIVWMRKNGQDFAYVNGKLNTNPQYYSNNPSGDYINQQHSLYIGSFNSLFTKDYQFKGKIDDIMIYDRAIDSSEVAALYNESNQKLSGPLFYYPFNGNTNDESGNNNVCTNHGATLTTDRFGNANSAYYFDGQTNFMDINPVSKVDSLQDFTLSVWFAHDGWQYSSPTSSSDPSIIGQQYIISGHSLSPSNYNVSEGIGVALQLQTDSIASILPYYHWDVTNPGSNRVVQQIPDQTYNTKWIHIVWIRKNGQDYAYVNGKLNTNPQYYSKNPSSDYINQQHSLYIGSFNSLFTKDYQFKGKIDDIMIYDRAIDSSEVSALFGNYTPLKTSADTLSIAGKVSTTGSNCSDGIIILYKKQNNCLTPVCYKPINADGTYKFDSLYNASYSLYVIPNSSIISDYVPTYYCDKTAWSSANYVDLQGQAFEVDIALMPIIKMTFNGKCTIKGNVCSDDSLYKNIFASNLKSDGIVSQNIVVNLFQNGNIVASTVTDESGNYTFANVPVGSYQISVEHAGYPSSTSSVVISDTTTTINNLNFSLIKAMETVIPNVVNSEITIYPNPAINTLNYSVTCSIQIISIDGKILINQSQVHSTDISQLPSGMYMVKMQTENNKTSRIFIKQ